MKTPVACALAMIGLLAPGVCRAQQPPVPPAPVGAEKLPAVIPIFPLEDAMLFPDVSRPLHIFESRYRAMIADALKGDRVIGMVTLRPGYESNYEGRPEIHPIGCAGEIVDVEELPDGRYNVVLRGFVKFRVVSEDQSKAYRLARVDALPEVPDESEKDAIHDQRLRVEALLGDGSAGRKIPPTISDVEVINAMAEYAPIAAGSRQTLLEINGVLARSRKLVELLQSNADRRASGLSTLNEDQIAERGARLARRDDREYREYLREE